MNNNSFPDLWYYRRGNDPELVERIAKLEAQMDGLSRDVDDIKDVVYDMRDKLMKLLGRTRNGSSTSNTQLLFHVISALLGALLAIIGVRVMQ